MVEVLTRLRNYEAELKATINRIRGFEEGAKAKVDAKAEAAVEAAKHRIDEIVGEFSATVTHAQARIEAQGFTIL